MVINQTNCLGFGYKRFKRQKRVTLFLMIMVIPSIAHLKNSIICKFSFLALNNF